MPDNNLSAEVIKPDTTTGGGGHETIRVTAGAPSEGNKEPQILTDKPREPWLPQNFKTVEAFVASQKEGQATITRLTQELAALKKGQPVPVETPVEGQTKPAVTEPATLGPMDMQVLANEWLVNGGKLTDKSIQELDRRGIPPEMVGRFISGQEAIARENAASLEAVAGGKDQLLTVLEWTGKNNVEAGNAYNKAYAAGDVDTMRLMLRGMVSAYQDRVGRDPRVLIRGEVVGASGQGEAPFMTYAEASQAMSDPRYKTSETYRRSVARRMTNLK